MDSRKAFILFGIIMFSSLIIVSAPGILFDGSSISYNNRGILNNPENITLQNNSLFIVDETTGFLKAYFNVPRGSLTIPGLINGTFPDTFLSNTSTGFLGDVDNFDSRNAFSRFRETNLNNGSNASAGFIGVNDIGKSISMGIGSSNFTFLNISLPNVGVIRLKSPGQMIFANDFLTSWLWATDLNNGTDFSNAFTSMRLSPLGNLNISGNFTVNASVTFPHIESAATPVDSVTMFCQPDDNCYLQLSNGETRRILDLPSSLGNFSEGSILFMGPNNRIRGDVENFFWNETENRMAIGTQIAGHPLHIFDPQTIMAKFESSTAGAVGIQVSSGVLGGDAYIRFTEGNESEDWIVGLDDTANRFFIENSITPTDNSPFVILSSGNVGIGTDLPRAQLEIEVNSNDGILIDTSSASLQSRITFADQGTIKWIMGKQTANAFFLWDNANGRDVLRVKTDGDFILVPTAGNVGIGTESPQDKLHVKGNIRLDNNQFLKGERIDGGGANLIGFNGDILEIGENTSIPINIRILTPTDIGQGLSVMESDGVTTALFVENNGLVGIGTTTPSVPLEIESTSQTLLTLFDPVSTEGEFWRMDFDALDTFANQRTYTRLLSTIVDNSPITGDGQFIIQVLNNDILRNMMVFENTEVVLNQDALDMDFRVESINNAQMLFVDGGNDRVGIGTDTPGAKLEVKVNGGDGILIDTSSAFLQTRLTFSDDGTVKWIMGKQTDNTFFLWDNNNSRDVLRVNTNSDILLAPVSGNVGIDQTNPLAKLHIGDRNGTIDSFIRLSTGNGVQNREWELGTIYGDTNITEDNYDFLIRDLGGGGATKFLIEFDTGNVGIGTITPEDKLHVNGSIMLEANQFLKGKRPDGEVSDLIGFVGQVIVIGSSTTFPSNIRILTPSDLGQGFSVMKAGGVETALFVENTGVVQIPNLKGPWIDGFAFVCVDREGRISSSEVVCT